MYVVVCVCVCVCVWSITQSCPTLCNPMDCSPPGSSVHGIFQGRLLEWVSNYWSYSRGSSWPWDQTSCVSCIDRWIILPLHHLRSLLIGVQFSSVQSLSSVRLFMTPWIVARQASLSITNSQSLVKLMPIESVMPSSHLILCRRLLLLPPIPPSIRVFSNELALSK